jgi:hypothetical protein
MNIIGFVWPGRAIAIAIEIRRPPRNLLAQRKTPS